MAHHTTHYIDLDDLEIQDGDQFWACHITCEAEVESDTDYGDNGLTSWGSGPSIETTIAEETAEAVCCLLSEDGEILENKTLTGKEAIDFVGDDKIIDKAEEEHNSW